MIMGSSCPRITASRSKLEKIISGVGDGFYIFIILSEDRLRTSWRCFLPVDFVIPPPAKPLAMTLTFLVIDSSSSFPSRVFSGSNVLWFLRFRLSSSFIEGSLLFQGLLCEAMYFANLPSRISFSIHRRGRTNPPFYA